MYVLRLAARTANLSLQRYCVNTACGAPASGQPRVRPAPAGHAADLGVGILSKEMRLAICAWSQRVNQVLSSLAKE